MSGSNKSKLDSDTSYLSKTEYIGFNYRQTNYYYKEEVQKFIPIEFDYNMSYESLLEKYSEYVQEGKEYKNLVSLYGLWNIHIPELTIPQLLFTKILNPFYIFQLYSVILWFCTDYYYYASWILVISIFTIINELITIKKNVKNLKEMAKHNWELTVRRLDKNGRIIDKTIDSNELVPGDKFLVKEDIKMPCDAILLSGSAIVNESMLTGESIPVFKSELPKISNKIYDPEVDTKYTLFSGTHVIQWRKTGNDEDIYALVIRTNFNTIKGSLIKSILYPKPSRFNFYTDALKFVAIMGLISMFGWACTVDVSLKYLSTKETIVRFLDLITISVPPALPAAMSVGIMFALSRLRDKKIYWINPLSINAAGRVQIIVFDKTGTLTEEGLNVAGLKCKKSQYQFYNIVQEISTIFEENEKFWKNREIYKSCNSYYNAKYLEWMACCHWVAEVQDKFIGDPLDIEMFKATNWVIDETEETNHTINEATLASYYPFEIKQELDQNDSNKDFYKLGIIKRFDFSSNLQCMSVISKSSYDDEFVGFVKGSPERIKSISVENTIPNDFDRILQNYTQDGLRVLALSYKYLPETTYQQAKSLEREEIEWDVIFLGFLVLQNMVKPATKKSLQTLQNAAVETLMATGDNGLTAVSVARECGIINPNKVAYMAELVETDQNEKMIEWSKIGVPKSGVGRRKSVKLELDSGNYGNHLNRSSIEEIKNNSSELENMMIVIVF